MPEDKTFMEAFQAAQLNESTKRVDSLVDKLTKWFKKPIQIPLARDPSPKKLDRIIEGLEKILEIERVERGEERKDNWIGTYKFNLSTARDKEIVPIPFTIIDLSALACSHLDDDFSLFVNGEEIEFTTTMTMRDYDFESVEITNSASSGWVKLYAQGKRKN